MKSIHTIVDVMSILTAAGLAIGVAVERQASRKLEQENKDLGRQLSAMDTVSAERPRRSNLPDQAQASPLATNDLFGATSATDERAKELAALRAEVEALRAQAREIAALRADTRQVRAARENALQHPSVAQRGSAGNPTVVNGSPFEILKAEYGTQRTNMDVAVELSERIGSDGLKAVASNNLKGDPEFGEVKQLTVVYRFGGVTRTNTFREGDVIMLPEQ